MIRAIQADYEQLQRIAQTFAQHAEATQLLLLSLQWAKDVLQEGDWAGRSSAVFYAEMDAAVLPAMKRLIHALKEAARTTLQILAVIQQAETAAAVALKGPGNGASSASDERVSPWALLAAGAMGVVADAAFAANSLVNIFNPVPVVLRERAPLVRPATVNAPDYILLNGFTTTAEFADFAQSQTDLNPYADPDGCAPFTAAMVVNLLYGTRISGEAMQAMYEQEGLKFSGLGMLPNEQRLALNVLFAHANAPFRVTLTTHATEADLLSNLQKGYLTIINTSNGTEPFGTGLASEVGHAMVLVGYDTTDPTEPKYLFLDPMQRQQTGVIYIPAATFLQHWLRQPNFFIESGTVLTVKPK